MLIQDLYLVVIALIITVLFLRIKFWKKYGEDCSIQAGNWFSVATRVLEESQVRINDYPHRQTIEDCSFHMFVQSDEWGCDEVYIEVKKGSIVLQHIILKPRLLVRQSRPRILSSR